MTKIPESGFMLPPFQGPSGTTLPLRCAGAIVLLLLAASWAQAQNPPATNSTGKNKPSPAISPTTIQEVDLPPDVPPPAPATAEQKPPQPPTVAWDGKLLTIDADNSTLAAVLVAVRERTGATIEIPGAASGERVFLHLGPGPARDVLSDLLYGTPFDYIVEAADDDPDTLRKVVLTARGLGDSSSDVVVAGATSSEGSGSAGSTLAADAPRSRATEPLAHPEKARMMPGWASSGKPTSQAEAEAAWAAQQAAKEKEQESAVAQDPPASQESAAAQDSATSQESHPALDQESHPALDSTAAEDSTTTVHAAEAAASNSSPSSSDSNDQSAVGQAIQNMNRMFEQRRQLQAQQNQPPPQSSN